jgi:hypothetical protein
VGLFERGANTCENKSGSHQHPEIIGAGLFWQPLVARKHLLWPDASPDQAKTRPYGPVTVFSINFHNSQQAIQNPPSRVGLESADTLGVPDEVRDFSFFICVYLRSSAVTDLLVTILFS